MKICPIYFGVEGVFVGTDGSTDVHYTNFSPDILDWQFLSDVYVAKKDYTEIRVSYTYCRNANLAFVDGLALFREEFGQSYTYDDENNLISSVDAQKNTRSFEYNSANDLTGVVDALGNMLTQGTTSYTWTQGRKLAGVNNGKSIQYEYDHAGMRTKKTVDGTVTEYRYAGSLLLSEKKENGNIWYGYDAQANLISINVGGTDYYYLRNAQNDIIGLIDTEGTPVVRYTYDTWGVPKDTTGTLASTVGKLNPFRYRGYYYDEETGMYYLQSRYYDPKLRRFICADEVMISTNKPSMGLNLFNYCFNNPVNMKDDMGHWPKWVENAAKVASVAMVGISAVAWFLEEVLDQEWGRLYREFLMEEKKSWEMKNT